MATKPTVLQKLFGPFKGLNKSQTPMQRALPPAPNAAALEFATEANNVYIEPKTAELVSRLGIEYVDGTATESTGGMFKFIDYDSETGKPKERAVLLRINRSTGVPSLNVYTLVKAELRSTSATLDGKFFAIIENHDNSNTKTVMIYDADGTTVSQNSTTLDSTLSGLSNIQVNYVNYDSNRDGSILMSSCDLLPQTELTYSATNETGTNVAEFYVLAKRTVTNANLDLTTYLDDEEDADAQLWTACQPTTTLLMSSGKTPILKYDGQNLYKAGMPDAVIRPFEIEKNAAEDANAYDVSRLTPPDGAYTYVQTIEYVDNKNNFLEGKEFFKEEAIATSDLEKRANIYVPSADGRVILKLDSLQDDDGFNVKGAKFDADQIVTSVASNPVINVTADHTLEINDMACFRVILEGDFTTLGKQYQLLLLLESPVVSKTSTTVTLDKDKLIVTYIPQNDLREDLDNGNTAQAKVTNPSKFGQLLESNVKNWDDLLGFDWSLADGTIRSGNLMGDTDGDPDSGIDLASSVYVKEIGKWNYFVDTTAYVDGEGGTYSAGTTFGLTTLDALSGGGVIKNNLGLVEDIDLFRVVGTAVPSSNPQGSSYYFEVPELLAGQDIKIDIPYFFTRRNDGGFGAVERYQYYVSIYDIVNATNTVIHTGSDLITGVIPANYYDDGPISTTYSTATNTVGCLISFYYLKVAAATTEYPALTWGRFSLTMEILNETVTNEIGLDDSWRYMSNNLRLNLFRNKGEALSTSDLGDTVPNLYLWGIYPNAYNLTSATTIAQHDTLSDNSLGYLYEPKAFPLLFNEKLPSELQDVDYSPLPKGKAIFSFKGRVYLGADPEAVNTLHRSDLLYGPEYYRAEDALDMETSLGDKIVGIGANNNIIYVMKDASIKAIEGDFENDKLRVFDLFLGEFGCTSARTITSIGNDIVFLGDEGPVIIRDGREISHLGETREGISRVREIVKDGQYDLTRAVAITDHNTEQYKVFIPKADKKSVGLFNPALLREANSPIYNDQGIMLVYDYNNDAWFTQTGIMAKGGMVQISGRSLYLAAYAVNTTAVSSSLEWQLYKDRDYNNLTSYVDRYARKVGVSEALRAISKEYTTDWIAFDDVTFLKNFLRFKVYNLNMEDDLDIVGTSTTNSLLADFTLTIQTNQDWREDKVQSSSTVTINDLNKYAYMKLKGNRSGCMRFKVTHNMAQNTLRIAAMEVEVAAPFKPKMKPWGVGQ